MSREADNYGLLGETPPSHASRSGALMKYLIGFVVVAMVYVGLVATSNSNDMVALRGWAISATTLPEVSLADTELLSPRYYDEDDDDLELIVDDEDDEDDFDEEEEDNSLAEQEDDSLEDVADKRRARRRARKGRKARRAAKKRRSKRKAKKGKKRARRRRRKKKAAAAASSSGGGYTPPSYSNVLRGLCNSNDDCQGAQLCTGLNGQCLCETKEHSLETWRGQNE